MKKLSVLFLFFLAVQIVYADSADNSDKGRVIPWSDPVFDKFFNKPAPQKPAAVPAAVNARQEHSPLMIYFTLCTLAAIGMTLILVRGVIFQPLRNYLHNTFLEEMVNCCQCTGFWAGVFWGLCYSLLTHCAAGAWSETAIIVFGFGCMNSLLSMAADIVFDLFYRIGKSSDVPLPD